MEYNDEGGSEIYYCGDLECWYKYNADIGDEDINLLEHLEGISDIEKYKKEEQRFTSIIKLFFELSDEEKEEYFVSYSDCNINHHTVDNLIEKNKFTKDLNILVVDQSTIKEEQKKLDCVRCKEIINHIEDNEFLKLKTWLMSDNEYESYFKSKYLSDWTISIDGEYKLHHSLDEGIKTRLRIVKDMFSFISKHSIEKYFLQEDNLFISKNNIERLINDYENKNQTGERK